MKDCNVVGYDQLNILYSGKKLVFIEYIITVALEHDSY